MTKTQIVRARARRKVARWIAEIMRDREINTAAVALTCNVDLSIVRQILNADQHNDALDREAIKRIAFVFSHPVSDSVLKSLGSQRGRAEVVSVSRALGFEAPHATVAVRPLSILPEYVASISKMPERLPCPEELQYMEDLFAFYMPDDSGLPYFQPGKWYYGEAGYPSISDLALVRYRDGSITIAFYFGVNKEGVYVSNSGDENDLELIPKKDIHDVATVFQWTPFK